MSNYKTKSFEWMQNENWTLKIAKTLDSFKRPHPPESTLIENNFDITILWIQFW